MLPPIFPIWNSIKSCPLPVGHISHPNFNTILPENLLSTSVQISKEPEKHLLLHSQLVKPPIFAIDIAGIKSANTLISNIQPSPGIFGNLSFESSLKYDENKNYISLLRYRAGFTQDWQRRELGVRWWTSQK